MCVQCQSSGVGREACFKVPRQLASMRAQAATRRGKPHAITFQCSPDSLPVRLRSCTRASASPRKQPLRHFTDVGLHLTGLAFSNAGRIHIRGSALSPVQAEVRAALLNHSRPPCPWDCEDGVEADGPICRHLNLQSIDKNQNATTPLEISARCASIHRDPKRYSTAAVHEC